MKFHFNWKHTLFHFLALWFCGHAVMVLICLQDIQVAETVRLSNNENEILTAVSLSKLNVSMALGFSSGYFIALIIGFLVSRRIQGTWINTLIAFVILILTIQLNLTGWKYLKGVFLFLGGFFDGWLYYVINGGLLISIGIFFLFGIKYLYTKDKLDHSTKSPQYA